MKTKHGDNGGVFQYGKEPVGLPVRFGETPIKCCCQEHHTINGRCLQCPIHGINPPTMEEKEDSPIMSFICAHCGSFSSTEWDSIDNGTMLECNTCGKLTVVGLFTKEDYTIACDALYENRRKK